MIEFCKNCVTRNLVNKWFLISLTFIVLTFFGCYNSKEILIKNEQDSNFNLNKDSVPVTVFLFHLKDVAKFKRASLLDLINRSDIVLGKDKIDSIRTQIIPDDEKVVATIDKNEVPYLGILVVYNDMSEKKKVKALIKSDKIPRGLLRLQIKKDGVFITNSKDLI